MVVAEALKVRLNLGREPHLYYFRDSNGCEVDLVHSSARQLLPVEIKSAQTFTKSFLKGLHFFEKTVGERALPGVVLYAGSLERDTEEYRLNHFTKIGTILSGS